MMFEQQSFKNFTQDEQLNKFRSLITSISQRCTIWRNYMMLKTTSHQHGKNITSSKIVQIQRSSTESRKSSMKIPESQCVYCKRNEHVRCNNSQDRYWRHKIQVICSYKRTVYDAADKGRALRKERKIEKSKREETIDFLFR